MLAMHFTPIRIATLLSAAAAVALGAFVGLARSSKPQPAVAADDRVLPAAVSADGAHLARFASRPYHLEKIYESMQGPNSAHLGLVITPEGRQGADEVVWVNAIRTRVVDAQTLEPIEQDFFCHSNLELEASEIAAEEREEMFGASRDIMDSRLFTLVPGRLDVRLPEGFAVPLMPGEALFYQSMVLNLSVPDIDRHVRVLTEVEVVPSAQREHVRPLYRRALYALQDIDPNAPKAMTAEQAEQCGCGPGNNVSASSASVLPRFGGDKTLHWYVPPGPHEYVQDVTEQLSLTFDTRIHYATTHLHPTGRWAELRDVTAGETVLRLEARDHADRRGVSHVDEIRSAEGIQLHAGHTYELVTFYDNTTKAPVDAMSILYLYLAGRDAGGQPVAASSQQPRTADAALGGA